MAKTVADVMNRDIVTVKPETPINDAIHLLSERKISGLPVVNDEGKLVGVLSESDLMWRESGVTPPAYIMVLDSVIYLENPARYERELHKALGQTVKEVMTEKSITTIHPDQPLTKAAKLLLQRDIRRLPVVDDQNRLVGILTRGDVMRVIAADAEE